MAGALIGALRVSLSAETSAFEAGMKRSQKVAKQTANSIVSDFKQAGGAMTALKAGVAGFVASLSVGTIIAAGKAALDYAGSLAEVAQQLGVTTRDLQVLRYAAGQVGVSQEQLETGLSKLTITLGRVAAGASAPIKALNAIGVSVDQLKGKDSGEAFRIIADGLEKVTDRSQRAAVEVALFGKSGASLDNLLSGGSKAINELSAAADKLGIVLSDEQIQKADDTADKLEALKTVLSAQIAGEVADNADAILKLADSLAELIHWVSSASAAWSGFLDNLSRKWSIPAQFNKLVKGEVFGFNTPGQSVTVPLGPVKVAPRPRATGGSNISQFLAGGGGGGRSRRGGGGAGDAERQRQQALRDAHQFDDQIRRAQMDVLQAMRDLSNDAVERYAISIQIKDAEKASYDAELKYQVAAGELTKAQADQLQLEYDKRDSLERQKMIADENERAFEESAKLDDLQFDLERERLQSEQQLAETAEEQRDVQLKLLDLYYRQTRARLNAVLADEQASETAKEEARRRLANLNKTYTNDRKGVEAGTRGPLEQYLNELPTTAEKWNEALQQVAVDGLKSVEDGLLDILDGTKSVGEAFRDMAQSIIRDLLRIAIRRFITAPLARALFGGFSDGGQVGGFATGGFVSGRGTATSDSIPAMLSNGEFVVNAKAARQFMPLLKSINEGGAAHYALGGLAVARTSYSARISTNDNAARSDIPPFVFNNYARMTEREARQTGLQAANAFRSSLARSVRNNG